MREIIKELAGWLVYIVIVVIIALIQLYFTRRKEVQQ